MPTSAERRLADGLLLIESPGTLHRDYVLADYAPRRDPAGALHNASLLRFALNEAGLLDAAWPIVEKLRDALGPEEVVWGLKYYLPSRRFALEFYLYNNAGNPKGQPKSFTRLKEVLAPVLSLPLRADERWPYFMWSFDLDAAALEAREAMEARVYFEAGRPLEGLSYRLSGSELSYENHYAFFRAEVPAERAAALDRLRRSPRAPGGEAAALATEDLLDCFTICCAAKPDREGLYFSRIGTAALARFLRRHLPGALPDFVEERRGAFEHLSWDVGLDFRPAGAGVEVTKVGVYGVI